jgi:putative resolvase
MSIQKPSTCYSVGILAKMVGRNRSILQRWDRLGLLKAQRTPANQRFYTHEQYLQVIGETSSTPRQTAVFCRVPGAAQKADLASQCAAMEQLCLAKGLVIDSLLTEIGCGLIGCHSRSLTPN